MLRLKIKPVIPLRSVLPINRHGARGVSFKREIRVGAELGRKLGRLIFDSKYIYLSLSPISLQIQKPSSKAELISREICRERNLSRGYLFRRLYPRQIDRGTEP